MGFCEFTTREVVKEAGKLIIFMVGGAGVLLALAVAVGGANPGKMKNLCFLKGENPIKPKPRHTRTVKGFAGVVFWEKLKRRSETPRAENSKGGR